MMQTHLLLLLLVFPVLAQEAGWEADKDIIRERETQQSEFNWRESNIPDYDLPDLWEMLQDSDIHPPEAWH